MTAIVGNTQLKWADNSTRLAQGSDTHIGKFHDVFFLDSTYHYNIFENVEHIKHTMSCTSREKADHIYLGLSSLLQI